MSPFRSHLMSILLVLSSVLVTGPVAAEVTEGYQVPPQTLVDLVDRPPTPFVITSPDDEWLLFMHRSNLPSIAELAEPELRLAGLRFKPQNNGPSRRRPYNDLSLMRISDGQERPIEGLPEDARLNDIRFSPDGRHLVFTHTRADKIELWTADLENGKARRLTDAALNLNAQLNPDWLASSNAVVCAFVPDGRGAAPAAPSLPGGPVVQENLGKKSPARTYQDLLTDAHDEAVFEHYLTVQLAKVDLDGKMTKLGEPGLIWDYDVSPDGKYLLVETIERPFSYLVPVYRFPLRVDVLDTDGKLIKNLASLPLRESVPVAFGSVAEGPRSFSWRQDAPATVVWAKALDGGDAAREAEFRDQLFLWDAPWSGEPTTWAKLKSRYAAIDWARDDLALVTTQWFKTRNIRVSRLFPGSPEKAPELLVDRSWEDRYNDPGRPLKTTDERGRSVLMTGGDGRLLYLSASGASPEGDRPFLDVYDLTTRETRRLFRSEAPYFERPVTLLGGGERYLLTRRESVEEPPNYFVRDLGNGTAPRRLTDIAHPTPELKGIYKELVHFKRDDGVDLTGTLYLPPGRKPGDGALPMLMWAYPIEYKSSKAAGQVKDSPYRFDRIGWYSPLLWLTQGYAVLDDPQMPIIGEDEDEPNDTFREQLVSSAKAAVDEMVRRGVTKPGQIAIGGHSYGAFMTANLLAHSDLFAAGIARSGAYNRTLTPFGFQREERTVWEAPDVYFTMSPFMHAEKVNEPILLIHGAADNNSGTFPMQSERYYNALKGHGATARLVMLPHESHGYRARESVLHMLWESHEWLERYVKNGQVPKVERGTADPGARD